jgi:hypothetical protein
MTPTESLIIDQMWERSRKAMLPGILKLAKHAKQDEIDEKLEDFLQKGKTVWTDMMASYLSQEDIKNLIQSFHLSTQIDEGKICLFQEVYTNKVFELAEECFN